MNRVKFKREYTAMLWVIAALAILFLLACIYLGVNLTGGRRQTIDEAMNWQSSKYDTSFYGRAYVSDYTVSCRDGYVLNAQLIRNPSGDGRYVIISHGYTDNRAGALKYARFWLELGYSCVIYDLRGHGLNEESPCTYSIKESEDLADLVSDTRERYSDLRVLGLHGESLGAATTVASLGHGTEPDFAVADCGYSDLKKMLKAAYRSHRAPAFLVDMADIGLRIRYGFSMDGMRPVTALGGCSVPLLFVHGADDRFILPENSREMYDAAEGYKEICFVDGAAHAESAIVSPDLYLGTLRGFLERAGIDKNQE